MTGPPTELNVHPPAATRGWLRRALDVVERAGNALPHPASLFVILSLVVVVLSWALHALGVRVTHPATGEAAEVVNLLSADGAQRLVLGLLPNFINFAPFGPVLVCLLGLSVAEHSGFLGAVVRVIIGATPPRLLTLIVVFIGATSTTAGDVGYVLLLPLSAALFHSAGRNPLTGLAAAFAGVSGGFAANLLLSPTDVILAGITQEAARIIDPAYVVTPMASYYFLASSVFLVTITGTLVTERVIEPRLGRYTGDVVPERATPLNAAEWRGLRWALVATVFLTALVLWGLIPADGFLQDPKRPGFIGSYFLRGLVAWIFVFGLVPGLVYGAIAGSIRSDVDVYRGMQKNMELIAGYTVVIFFIAQFVNLFAWSNLGVILAVQGAMLLRALQLGPIPLLVGLVVITALIDLLLGSSSAKWAMLGPVLVPMFMLLAYSPELTQTAYRVGDSLTNIVTPLSSNFPLVLMFFQRYMPKAGIGTLTATMLPYSLANMVGWTLMLVLWVLLQLPTGPGAPLFLAR
jgi:aminobenzoyl-glutamate transport protein